MMTKLQESMTSGVFVEFHDGQGNTVGQAVFTDWQGRPVPGVGDVMRCAARNPMTGRREQLVGQVMSRHFEVQHDDGQACVWVRLALTISSERPPRREIRFSDN
jgi:hypothetical protein